MAEETAGVEVSLGGEKFSAKEDYLKTVTNLLYKINASADSKSIGDMQLLLNFYTEQLIASILNTEARDAMRIAKDDIYQSEKLKIRLRKTGDLTEAEDTQARIAACNIIIGEIRQYMDKYFGIETRLAALI